jgi:hypothetical protein
MKNIAKLFIIGKQVRSRGGHSQGKMHFQANAVHAGCEVPYQEMKKLRDHLGLSLSTNFVLIHWKNLSQCFDFIHSD